MRPGSRSADSCSVRGLLPTGGATVHCCDKIITKSLQRKEGENNESKGKGSPYSTAERRFPELIPVLGSQPAGDVSHKPSGRLPLLSARPAVTLATLKTAAASFAAW